MSLHKRCRIYCDNTLCTAHIDGFNAATARHHARELGWLIRPSTDLCPQHRPNTRAAHPSRKDT